MELSGIFGDLVDKLEGWVEGLILLLPNFVAAAILVVVFALLAKGVRRVVHGVLRRTSSMEQVNSLLATIAYVVVLAVGLFLALGVLGLDKTVTSLLAGAGIIGLALGFAFQDLASNFIAGILLAVRRPFSEGDIIETADHMGVVEDLNLRSTWVRTFQGQRVIIPNSQVFQNPVTNYSRGSRRVDVRCGVAYGDDLEQARDVTLAAVRGLDAADPDRPIDLYFEEFGDSSINFVVRFWVDFRKQTDFLAAQSEAIIAIKKALDEAGLTIPFPIRTLDFGVVGGERLDEVLPQRFYEGGDGSGRADQQPATSTPPPR
ncbi:MAG: mechanosensitive ion channel [Rhodothermales bacterium]|nr:mechanosensitive ion channel [Rhodothermales bacterium]